MNQSILPDQTAKLPTINRVAKSLPKVSGGATLSNLSSSPTGQRLKSKRETVRNSYPVLSPGRESAEALAPALPSEAGAFSAFLPEAREEIGWMLNRLIADEYALYAITRDYHWNVSGPDYYSLRLLFQLQHEKAAEWVDGLAELIRELPLAGRVGWDGLKKSTRCQAAGGFGLPAEKMLSELLRVHNEMIAQLRADGESHARLHGDASTAGFLSDLRDQHENAAWMIRTQLGIVGEPMSTPA